MPVPARTGTSSARPLKPSVRRRIPPWTADARAVYARVLHGLGQKEQAQTMIGPACETLLNAWDPDHRNSRNALQIQSEILRSQA